MNKNTVIEASKNIRERAYYSKNICWEAVDSYCSEKKNLFSTIEEAHEYIRYLLVQLNDHHSFLATKEIEISIQQSIPELPKGSGLKSEIGLIGYVEIPGFILTRTQSESDYIRVIRSVLEELNSQELKGWIVDLRKNNGGDMWPMLAALQGLLIGPTVGYFIDRKMNRTAWNVENGSSMLGELEISKLDVSDFREFSSSLPVAVVTGNQTCSSGEAIAVSFRSQSNARQFGMETSGSSTANEGFRLPCGSMMWLTTAVLADRSGTEYGGKILPDQFISSDAAEINLISEIAEWMNLY